MTISKCASPDFESDKASNAVCAENTPDMQAPHTGTVIVCDSTPAKDGFIMPAEFEKHAGCIMIWPERPGSWPYGAKHARIAFRNVIAAIAAHETVYVAATKTCIDSALDMIFDGSVKAGSVENSWRFDKGDNIDQQNSEIWKNNVEIFLAQSDDAWARDIAPTFVIRREATQNPAIRGVNWSFNAWGGVIDGAYAHWNQDDSFAREFCEKYHYEMYDAAPFVLEGGSIQSDGEGTLLVTEACLLSKGRNPHLSRDEIENCLKAYLGVRKVLWLPHGIYLDETNEHVDNVCTFLRPGEVVLAWTDNEDDPQYQLSAENLAYLEQNNDALGRKLIIHKLPIPDIPIRISDYEAAGYEFEEGEDEREVGERLAASYVNFYFANNAVVLPIFEGDNELSDKRAISLLKKWCPDRTIIPISAREILLGGGNIHCITQQIPVCSHSDDIISTCSADITKE